MTDIHNHILFAIDDGSPDIETSVEMCRDAYENGYKAIVVTPHFANYNRIDEFVDERDYKIGELQKALQSEEIPLTVLSGADLFLSDSLLKSGNIDDLAINNSRYMLCEFPLRPFN
ncbi:MAG: capsular biosynthesis protein, partial [Clostridia bacterium]|nr:capsular biosynthesis protein [Clostridia bacterium]